MTLCQCRHVVARHGRLDLRALAIDAPQHGVHQFAGANTDSSFAQLHGLRDRRVGRHAAHEEQLIDTDSQQVDDIVVELGESAGDALREHRVQPAALAQHAPQQLVHPATITRVEAARAPFERRVEQIALTDVGQHMGGRHARIRHAADALVAAGRGTTAFHARVALRAVDGGHS